MISRPHLLNPQGLLAAMVAMTLSGMAVAETAGRVNFVNGDVVAVAADGSKRPLTRGDFVNSGERIETNRGRVQIRFTDGSFLSLQPDTVFGVDNYTFSKAKPEEGSLLFNFVRGSMRTVSGAIGKVNRANYRVKTPVATIGIRGTGYAGTFRDGILLLSVNHGLVNLSNDQGNSNVGAGQTFQVRDGQAPEPAPANMTAGPRSNGPAGGQQRDDADDSQGGQNQDSGSGFVAGEQVNSDGGTIFDNVGPVLADSAPVTVNGVTTYRPLYTLGSPRLNEGTDSVGTIRSGLIAGFSAAGPGRGGISELAEPPLSAGNPVSILSYDTVSPATLVNVHTHPTLTGGLSFGEWTNGKLTLNGTPYTLGANQFMPYIIGTPATAPTGNLFVSYRLDSGSTPRAQNGGAQSGSLDHLDIGLYLEQGTADINLKVTLGQVIYQAVATGIQASLNGSGFSAGGIATTGSDCSAQGCSTDVSGFFSGSLAELLGVNYTIRGAQTGNVIGVAILDRDGVHPVNPVLPDRTTVIVNPDTGDKEFSPAYSFASPFTRDAGSNQPQSVLQVGATFFQTGGAQQGGLKSLSEISNGSPSTFFSSNTQYRNLTTLLSSAGDIAFGEMTDGTFTYGNTQVTLGSNQYIPYIIGSYPGALPSDNLIVKYGLQSAANATRPRLVNGADLAAVLNQLDITLNLGEGRIGVDMKVTLGTQLAGNQTVYTASAANIDRPGLADFSSFQLEQGELVAVGNGKDSSCNAGCQVVLAGFLSGQTSQNLGASYEIRGIQGSTLTGVAALGQTGSTPLSSTIADADRLDSIGDDTVYSGLFSLDGLGGEITREAALTARFDYSNGGLQRSTTEDLHYYGRAPGESVPVADSAHYKQTLSWGRWTSLTGSVLSRSPDGQDALPLLGRNLHYLIGAPAGQTAMTAYKDQGLTVSYNLVGGTQTTSLLAVNGAGVSALGGVPKSGNVMINFMNSTASMMLEVVSPIVNNSSGTDVLTTTPVTLASNGFSGTLDAGKLDFASLNVSFSGNACGECTGSAAGFVAGANADMVGLAYQYTASGSIGGVAPAPMTGVAGFEKNSSFPSTAN